MVFWNAPLKRKSVVSVFFFINIKSTQNYNTKTGLYLKLNKKRAFHFMLCFMLMMTNEKKIAFLLFLSFFFFAESLFLPPYYLCF